MHGTLRKLGHVSEGGKMASNIAAGVPVGSMSERGHVDFQY